MCRCVSEDVCAQVDAVLGQPLSADTQRTFYRPTAMSDFNNDFGGTGSAYGYGGGYEGDRWRSGGTGRFGAMEGYGNYGRFKRTAVSFILSRIDRTRDEGSAFLSISPM